MPNQNFGGKWTVQFFKNETMRTELLSFTPTN